MARMFIQKLGAQAKKIVSTFRSKSIQESQVRPSYQKGSKNMIWKIAKTKLQTTNLN